MTKLGGSQEPPNRIFGRFTQTFPDCRVAVIKGIFCLHFEGKYDIVSL